MLNHPVLGASREHARKTGGEFSRQTAIMEPDPAGELCKQSRD